MSTLDRLKDIPEMEIVEKLKISYDGLKGVEKELFLDIACFFRGESKNDAMEILEACGFYRDIGITVLSQKGLVTVSKYGIFDMHDLVQEMGHYIVRGKHLKNPEKHSRVWKNEEIKNMCLRNAKMENYKTEAIQFDGYSYGFCDIVSNMKKLRWVSEINRHHEYGEGPSFLSNELRYIYWQKYPKSAFPEKFHPLKLVVLKLPGSLQRELWKCHKHLPQLKMLELGDAKNLLSTPDFGELPSLQKLKLYSCDKLEEVHPSLGNHRSLEYVSVSDCRKLRMFPTITQMEKLETLEIKFCHKSFEFPEIQAKMGSLVKLSLNGIGIQLLLSSINDRCPNLHFLYMIDCFILKNVEGKFDGLLHLKEFRFRGFTRPDEKMPEPDHLPISPLIDRDRRSPLLICVWLMIPQLKHNLRKLDLRHCRLGEGEIPSDIGNLFNLKELDLSWNVFHI